VSSTRMTNVLDSTGDHAVPSSVYNASNAVIIWGRRTVREVQVNCCRLINVVDSPVGRIVESLPSPSTEEIFSDIAVRFNKRLCDYGCRNGQGEYANRVSSTHAGDPGGWNRIDIPLADGIRNDEIF